MSVSARNCKRRRRAVDDCSWNGAPESARFPSCCISRQQYHQNGTFVKDDIEVFRLRTARCCWQAQMRRRCGWISGLSAPAVNAQSEVTISLNAALIRQTASASSGANTAGGTRAGAARHSALVKCRAIVTFRPVGDPRYNWEGRTRKAMRADQQKTNAKETPAGGSAAKILERAACQHSPAIEESR